MTVTTLANGTLWCTCATCCRCPSHARVGAAGAIAPNTASSVPTAVRANSTRTATASSNDHSVAQRMAGANIACSSATGSAGAITTTVEPADPVGFTLSTDVDVQELAWRDGQRAGNPASV